MKKILLSSFFILLILSIGIPLNADAQTSKTHSIVVSSNTSTVKIPLVGTLTIVMKYSIDFDVRKPSIIEAGTTEKITLSPRNGVLTSTFYLDGKLLASIPQNLPLGSNSKFTVPSTLGLGEVYASPSLVVGMGVKGPSSASDYVYLNSMSSIDFPIRVYNEIGNSNSVTVNFPMRFDLKVGGNINLVLTNIPIASKTIPIEVSTKIYETIPLRKYYTTSTSLEVKDAFQAGYIQVYPTVRASSGELVSSSNLSVYADGQYKGKVRANSWSQEIYTGSGQKFVEIKFPATTSTSNSAIIYKDSEAFQSFIVKSPPPKLTSSQSSNKMIASAQSSGLQCGPGTHQDNEMCVPDNMDILKFFEDIPKQIEGIYWWIQDQFN